MEIEKERKSELGKVAKGRALVSNTYKLRDLLRIAKQ